MADTTEKEVEVQGKASTPALLEQALQRGSELVAAEVRLAKQEVTESISAAVKAVLGGALALFAGIAFVVMGIVTVILAVQPHWGAALGFTILFLLIAVAGAVFAITRLRRISPLRQTAETIKEDVEWAKRQLTRDAR
jgi:uncharacterized membrane protein YqjE